MPAIESLQRECGRENKEIVAIFMAEDFAATLKIHQHYHVDGRKWEGDFGG
jgi:hypothetical protein